MKTIKETLEQKVNGLFYGNRLILPFKANFLKIILDDDIITDFSPAGEKLYISENDNFTDLYFIGINNLQSKISKYEAVKMIVTEKNTDIFDPKSHIKLSVYLEEPHNLRVEKTPEDIPFID
jgi:hypothetical protein